MAFKQLREPNGETAIVINGFEAGVADSPEEGIAFMRNVNLVTVPGESAVNFATSAINVPPTGISGNSCTFTGATDIVTWTPTGTLYTGCAVTFGSSTGGVTSGTIYWITVLSSSTFKVYTSINRGPSTLVDLTDASNTFSVITFGTPSRKALDYSGGNVFLLDTAGRAWWINASGNLTFLGNTTLTNAHGNGICVFGNNNTGNTGFLFIFRDTSVDYLPLTELTANNAPGWVYAWNAYGLTDNAATGHSHDALVLSANGGMHFCNSLFIGRVLPTAGVTFDPTSSSTYTTTLAAPAAGLPQTDGAVCLAELNGQVLVGGIQNKVWVWDGLAAFYNSYIQLSEIYVTRMVTTNASTYIFAGNRGRIYITNGANAQLFKKVPDHIITIFSSTNGADPYFTWLDAMFWKNQIYFSFLVAKNDGTSITNMGGLWALDMSMNIMGTSTPVALRMTNVLSPGAAAYPYVIAPNIRTTTPAGAGLYVAWVQTLTSATGVDVSASTPYTDFTGSIGGEIYTDLIPTGTLKMPQTFNQVEWKLSQELVSGEAVRVSIRQSFSQAWTVLGSTTTSGLLSDTYPIDVQYGIANGQWVELYVELQSTASSPSLVRLKELRIR